MALNPTIFRAYDIRGKVGETLLEKDVYQIGCGFAALLQQRGQTQVIQARDGRLSSPLLHDILQQALLDSGCDVIDIGLVPTPVMYFATKTFDCSNGVMLTASHNPAGDNGFKMVVNGLPLMPEDIQALYELAKLEPSLSQVRGKLEKKSALALYTAAVLATVKITRPLKIVVDCANAVPSVIAPQLLRQLGCEVIELFCDIDGRFPNHAPDPSEIENLEPLITAVKHHQADLGFAFDGDGDRLMVIDSEGSLVFPDYLLLFLTQHLAKTLPELKVIYDVKSTGYLPILLKTWGVEPIMCRTGHSFVKLKMHEVGAAIAGEASGHIFWSDRWYGVDDGLYTAVRLLEILSQKNQSLAELMRDFPRGVATPEFKLIMADTEKFAFMQTFCNNAKFPEAQALRLDGLRVEFAQGWGLVRSSNTSPYLTFRFEANTTEDLTMIMQAFRRELLALNPLLVLPF